MLGLENSKIFGAIMIAGMCGIVFQIFMVSWLKGTLDNYHVEKADLGDVNNIIVSSALLSFAYPRENPKRLRLLGRSLTTKYFNGILIITTGLVMFFSTMTTVALTSLIIKKNTAEDSFVSIPIFQIMEDQNLVKVIPPTACLLVLSCSGAIMELFPEMYHKIVELTRSDWQILPKQIGYENRESGSHVLSIFTAGSLCAMLAFACPMYNLLYILGGSHLLGVALRANYVMYIRFRPKILINCKPDRDSSLNYSRLDCESQSKSAGESSVNQSSMKMSTSFRKLLSLTRIDSQPIRGSMKKRTDTNDLSEMEKEWLLLGESQLSPGGVNVDSVDQTTSPHVDCAIVDTNLIGPIVAGQDDDSVGSSTDIDAIVEEYREKVRVTTGGPMEGKVLRMPSTTSWKGTLLVIIILFGGVSLLNLGIHTYSLKYRWAGIVIITVMTIALEGFPKHVSHKPNEYQPVFMSVITITGALILEIATLKQCWPALLFWLFSGLALIIRCDLWCCSCLDKPDELAIIHSSTHQLNLIDVQPTLLITNPRPKPQFITTRLPLPIRGR